MNKYKLIDLYTDLDLPNTKLVITDDNSGRGYIATDDEADNVIVGWGSYQEGIRILEAYLRADSMPNV